MNKLIWRIRYTLYMAKCLGKSWWAYKVSWKSSGIHIAEYGDEWKDDDPKNCVDEELSYWK